MEYIEVGMQSDCMSCTILLTTEYTQYSTVHSDDLRRAVNIIIGSKRTI